MTSLLPAGLPRSVRVSVVRSGVQAVFARRLRTAASNAKRLVIASPWITEDSETESIRKTCEIISKYGIPTYIFTKPPDSAAHERALAKFFACPSVEVVLNPSLHAKVYACVAPYPYGFALLGSANLTANAVNQYEIGLLIRSGGGGDRIIQELADFGLTYIRTRPNSVRTKTRDRRRHL